MQTEKGGLALTVRGTGILPKTFTDEGRNLDKLLTQAGEYVYGQSQPGLWAAYLSNNDRNDEAIHFAQGAYATVDPSERPYVLNYWANAIAGKGGEGANREALSLYREAVRLKPDYWVAYNNIMNALTGLGDGTENYDQIVWDLPAVRAGNIADMESHSGIGTTSPAGGAENLQVAQFEVQMHDVAAAALRLKTTPVDEKNLPDGVFTRMRNEIRVHHAMRKEIAEINAR